MWPSRTNYCTQGRNADRLLPRKYRMLKATVQYQSAKKYVMMDEFSSFYGEVICDEYIYQRNVLHESAGDFTSPPKRAQTTYEQAHLQARDIKM